MLPMPWIPPPFTQPRVWLTSSKRLVRKHKFQFNKQTFLGCGTSPSPRSTYRYEECARSATSPSPRCQPCQHRLHHQVCFLPFVHINSLASKDAERTSIIPSLPTCITNIYICRYLSLKCLCAQVISNNNLPFKGEVPEVLETFIEAH